MLNVRGLDQYYGGSHTLRGIDLDVPEGTCTALLGRNGVGKTTLLRCLIGELPVARGTVELAGEDSPRCPPTSAPAGGWATCRRAGRSSPGSRWARTWRWASRRRGDATAPLSELEALFPILGTMRHRRGGDLSGGQQQQLAIARALVARPRLLLLDEPTEGIQPSTIKEIGRVLRALLERKMTIILVEQYLDFALELAEHCAVLSRGEIVLRGRIQELDPAQVRRHLAV